MCNVNSHITPSLRSSSPPECQWMDLNTKYLDLSEGGIDSQVTGDPSKSYEMSYTVSNIQYLIRRFDSILVESLQNSSLDKTDRTLGGELAKHTRSMGITQ